MNTNLKNQIISASKQFIDTYNTRTGNNIPYLINHRFDLKGQVAGSFCRRQNESYFRWNIQAGSKYPDDFLTQTVGHEVAHYIVSKRFEKATAHGRTWKNVMNILGLPSDRCHTYKLDKARTISKPWKYICPCGIVMTFTMRKYQSFISHGLKQGGETYHYCKKCKTYINVVNIKHVG